MTPVLIGYLAGFHAGYRGQRFSICNVTGHIEAYRYGWVCGREERHIYASESMDTIPCPPPEPALEDTWDWSDMPPESVTKPFFLED